MRRTRRSFPVFPSPGLTENFPRRACSLTLLEQKLSTSKKALQERGWYTQERKIAHGVQFVLTDETCVNCYNTGRVVVQGKAMSTIKKEADVLFKTTAPQDSATVATSEEPVPPYSQTSISAPTRVFIVYGHDIQAREQLELLLRRLKLEPIVLQNIPGAGDTIIEKLETLTDADFACVLLTPDDEGRKRSKDGGEADKVQPRARQNVVLELGMVLSRLGRRRVAILLKGPEIEKPSDISGLIYLPFNSHVDEVKNPLAANLQEAGFNIQVKDLLS